MKRFAMSVVLALLPVPSWAEEPFAGVRIGHTATGTFFGHQLSLSHDEVVGMNPFHLEITSATLPKDTAHATALLLADQVCLMHGMRGSQMLEPALTDRPDTFRFRVACRNASEQPLSLLTDFVSSAG